ncbi:MAG: DUF4375 domain-containing protein [Phycisphaerales bacterium JB040]
MSLAERNRRIEQMTVPDDPSPKYLRRVCKEYLSPDDTTHRLAKAALELLGNKADTELLRLLEKKKVRPPQNRESLGLWDEPPFDRVCERLAENRNGGVLPYLLPLLRSSVSKDRQFAARNIAQTGLSAATDHVLRVIDGSDKYARSRALLGIPRDGVDEDFRSRIFDRLAREAVTAQRASDDKEWFSAMVSLDQERARELFSRPEVLATRNARLVDLLGACLWTGHNQPALRIEREPLERVLLELLPQIEDHSGKPGYAVTYSFLHGLAILGQHHHGPVLERCIAAGLNSPEDRVRAEAAEAWMRTKGLPGYDIAHGVPATCPSVLGPISAVLSSHVRIESSGIVGWVESYGYQANKVIGRIRDLGATDMAEALEEAMRLMNPKNLEFTRDELLTRAAEFVDNREPLDPLETRIWKEPQPLAPLIVRYIESNLDEVRAAYEERDLDD